MKQTYNNPSTPFVWPIQGGLRDDFNILVSGTPQDVDGFSINLKCGPEGDDEVAFHFNPRFNQNKVVRNTKKAGQNWGSEERDGPFSFKKGCRFDLAILVQPTMYKVSVNGQHFCDYKHRTPLNQVSYIHISGGVKIDRVSIDLPPPDYSAESGMLAPIYNPVSDIPVIPVQQVQSGTMVAEQNKEHALKPMSFNQKIGGLYYGRMIYISGIPTAGANRFTINFCAGGDIGFHFDARLAYGNDKQALVRNTKMDNTWGVEERQVSHFPFIPDMFFDIIILVDPTCFKVAVNNSHLLDYNHRYTPLDKIDTLSITGDVKLCQIRFH